MTILKLERNFEWNDSVSDILLVHKWQLGHNFALFWPPFFLSIDIFNPKHKQNIYLFDCATKKKSAEKQSAQKHSAEKPAALKHYEKKHMAEKNSPIKHTAEKNSPKKNTAEKHSPE